MITKTHQSSKANLKAATDDITIGKSRHSHKTLKIPFGKRYRYQIQTVGLVNDIN